MTVIAAAITEDEGVVLVGDSEITSGFTKDVDGYSKLWTVNHHHNYIVGGCGSVRAIQIIKHWTDWPYSHCYDDDEEFAVKGLVSRIRDVLSEHGALIVSKKTESFDGSIILAYEDKLIVIDEDFSVTIPESGRYAIGSGQSEALGSLGNEGPWTKDDVIEAARRATLTALGVGGPLWIVSTKYPIVEQI